MPICGATLNGLEIHVVAINRRQLNGLSDGKPSTTWVHSAALRHDYLPELLSKYGAVHKPQRELTGVWN